MGEWIGLWLDGLKEWILYWFIKFDYCFEDDGVFWMSYNDMFYIFINLYCICFFDDEWVVV